MKIADLLKDIETEKPKPVIDLPICQMNFGEKDGRKSFGICLTCPYASYQDNNGSSFLFCGLEKRNVVDLLVCQKDVWKKDHLNRLI